MSDILSDDQIAALERDRQTHQRILDTATRQIADIDARLAAHDLAVYVREMPEPKLDIGTELMVTNEFHDLLKHRRWAKWELWAVGKIVKLTDFTLSRGVVFVEGVDCIGATGGIPIDMAQDMRRAYLAQEGD